MTLSLGEKMGWDSTFSMLFPLALAVQIWSYKDERQRLSRMRSCAQDVLLWQ